MDSRLEQAMLRAIDTMTCNLGEPVGVDDLARAAVFSKFHFSRIFHRSTGLTPGHFLTALRIAEAKRLLVTTALPVTEISHRVGYSSIGSFSSRFSQSVGVPPSVYRRLGGKVPQLFYDRERLTPEGRSGTVQGTVWSPADTVPVFVGLFADRILQGRPVASTVLPGPGPFVLAGVPTGTWHLMARSCSDTDVTHIGGHGPIVVRPGAAAHRAEVRLRPMGPLDPPVLLALPDMRVSELATG
jgi:AraC-like DNA-binding protein